MTIDRSPTMLRRSPRNSIIRDSADCPGGVGSPGGAGRAGGVEGFSLLIRWRLLQARRLTWPSCRSGRQASHAGPRRSRELRALTGRFGWIWSALNKRSLWSAASDPTQSGRRRRFGSRQRARIQHTCPPMGDAMNSDEDSANFCSGQDSPGIEDPVTGQAKAVPARRERPCFAGSDAALQRLRSFRAAP
jgi:hypothetical protein